ncbi:alanine--tRNA ligase [Rhodospirillaceae bacterium KN72]|uniref:Alanine--tRNA ligase n=1 Tax=Pacificispira spongiicola TaxID=2729598 RepID=A0A7Y0E2R9_9PROT|nr:alanine--tRNA ligase [Pacificispira spongiicola]NMM46136.1 alanine--tRNA ligase [Pacificispira spongiicola]
MASANDIRAKFLDFFAKNGHEVVDSSPLVPRNDPTLMFTNAGMVQFKNVFTGQEHRDYSRAATSQKCVRAGGKHNDLENVGYTARHHTFFEMLGNFSFGDYFKEQAIDLAWTLVTKEYGLPKDKLLVTVYSEDDEAHGLWKKIAGLSDDKIIRIPTSDNFWQMGDTGPCGPCSEIFFDHGDKIWGGPPGSAEEDGDRFIEIWNLVFMQFEQIEPGNRVTLPKPSIDTGMGLERIAAVLQGKHNNYDIDLMRAIIEAVADLTGVDPDGPQAASHKVITDHLRASSFLIADGVLPSNEGRGYVLRRIMRRAMRHAHMLGAKDPLMHRLVPSLVGQMGGHFEELRRAEALITETLKLEESRFQTTLDRGLKLLDEETADLPEDGELSGRVAFTLYDTYGFPLDLTKDILRGQGRTVDEAGYDEAMAEQKAKARKAWAGSGEAATESVWFDLKDEIGATEFFGYETEKAEGVVSAIVKDGKPVKSIAQGDDAIVIANQTPFYGESGGQMGDQGVLKTADGAVFTVTDTQKKLGDMHLHIGKLSTGALKVGDVLEMLVDGERRTKLRANHSVTHLAHEALRRVLGDHVTQKGSQVGADAMRFDFAHPKAMTQDEIEQVERIVNAQIRMNEAVDTRLMTPDEAIKAGALALFGEKYGEEVRVVSMGGYEAEKAGHVYSTELCGGTHVRRTGDIGLFHIVSEGAVAAGVRRIECLTGQAAFDYLAAQESRVRAASAALKVNPSELTDRVTSLMEERRKLEREVSELTRKLAAGGGGAGADAKDIAGTKFASRILDGVNPKELKPLADQLKSQLGSGVIALIAVNDGKASIVVGVTDDLTSKFDAVQLVRAGSEAMGGKGGGGRPDMAQGGAPDGSQAASAVGAIEAALR